jgi:hypothetical protein
VYRPIISRNELIAEFHWQYVAVKFNSIRAYVAQKYVLKSLYRPFFALKWPQCVHIDVIIHVLYYQKNHKLIFVRIYKMFSKDTVKIIASNGTPATTIAATAQCGPGELLTGFKTRVGNTYPYDTINNIVGFKCTNYVTGETRELPASIYAGSTNSGAIVPLECPTGSYITDLRTNWRGWGDHDRVISSIGFACKNFSGATTATPKAGRETIYPTACPPNYFLNRVDVTGGTVLNTINGYCLNMNPRKNVLAGTETTAMCCTDAGDPTICGEYKPQTGYCDKFFATFCAKNPDDPRCTCFNVPPGVPPCYAAKCLNTGYLTTNMSQSCPTQYISCDAQIAASNTGTQLAGNYTLQQNCGNSNAQGAATGGVNTSTGGVNTTVNTSPSAPIALQIFLIFIVFIAFIVIYVQYAYPGTISAIFSPRRQ